MPAWKVFWTVFGTSNQLLAALTLLTITVWLKRIGKPWWVSALPAVFVMTMTVWSLLLLLRPWMAGLTNGSFRVDAISLTAIALLALAALIVAETLKAWMNTQRSGPALARFAPHRPE